MATYTTQHPGNLALEAQVWTLTRTEADILITSGHLMVLTGSYWYRHLVRPRNVARHHGHKAVRVITAGFSTGKLANALYATGATVEAVPA